MRVRGHLFPLLREGCDGCELGPEAGRADAGMDGLLLWRVAEGGGLGLVLFSGGHGFAGPEVGFGEVFGARRVVAAGEVGVAAEGELKVLHGVVVAGAEFDGAGEVVEAVVDEGAVFPAKGEAGGARKGGVAVAVVGEAVLGEDGAGVAVGLLPVEDAEGVVGFGVGGLELEDVELGLAGKIDLGGVAINGGDLPEGGEEVGVGLGDGFEGLEGVVGGGAISGVSRLGTTW